MILIHHLLNLAGPTPAAELTNSLAERIEPQYNDDTGAPAHNGLKTSHTYNFSFVAGVHGGREKFRHANLFFWSEIVLRETHHSDFFCLGGLTVAGRQHNHRRTIRDERGRPLRSINVCEAEKVRLDREERLWRAMRDADSMAIGGPLRMDEMMAVAGLHGKRSCYHDSERYAIVGLIGNFADHANEKFQQYADVHDRRAVTVRADRKIWIPDAHQAAKRAKRYAQGAKN